MLAAQTEVCLKWSYFEDGETSDLHQLATHGGLAYSTIDA